MLKFAFSDITSSKAISLSVSGPGQFPGFQHTNSCIGAWIIVANSLSRAVVWTNHRTVISITSSIACACSCCRITCSHTRAIIWTSYWNLHNIQGLHWHYIPQVITQMLVMLQARIVSNIDEIGNTNLWLRSNLL